MQVFQSSGFKKTVKKLKSHQKRDVDDAVRTIINDPAIGIKKKGDLDFLRVYKFHMQNQLMLLGYEFREEQLILTLLAIGSHENFYRDIKNN